MDTSIVLLGPKTYRSVIFEKKYHEFRVFEIFPGTRGPPLERDPDTLHGPTPRNTQKGV